MKILALRNCFFFASLVCVVGLNAAPPAAPSDFIFSRSDGNDRASFTWVDNSDDETFFQFEITVGDEVPFTNSSPAANATGFTFTGFSPGSPVTFRLRSGKPLEGGAEGEFEFSEWTAAVEVVTRDLNIFPSQISIGTGQAFEYSIQKDFDGVIALIGGKPDWLDLDLETGVFSAVAGSSVPATVRFEISQGIHLRQESFVVDAVSKPPVVSSVVTGTPGLDFRYTLQTIGSFDQVEVTGALPAWLSLDGTTGVFTGTNPPAGSHRVDFEVTSGGEVSNHFLDFNIINEGPVLLAAPAAIRLEDNDALEVDLAQVFEEPDFIRAAAVVTAHGDITMGFYEGFPVTVANFFRYLENDAWDGAFFHRMAKLGNGENFVLQGGGFRPGAGEGEFARVTQFPAIVNEFDPVRPNLNGTISMAKLGGNPDSATNQFFISLNDNRSILDGQNGGFTVFGRAVNIDPVNLISTMDRGTFAVDIEGLTTSLGNWPVTELSSLSPSFEQLVTMQDVVEIPTLSYDVSMTGDAIVSAGVATTLNAPLVITPTGVFGETLLTLTATDLDGAEVMTTLPIEALATYERWAAREMVGEVDANDDDDPLTNFEEYAFGTNASVAEARGTLFEASVGDAGVGEFTFNHREHSADLIYEVESSFDLDKWDTIWTSSDGFDDARISASNKDGEILRLTVRGDSNPAAEGRIFFRLRVENNLVVE